MTFDAETSVDPGTLIRYVQRRSKTHRFDGPTRVRFRLPLESTAARIDAAADLLAALCEGARARSGEAAN